VRIGVGATLVRHSDPESEVAETKAKAAGLLAALGAGTTRFGTHPQVRALLDERNGTIARFWREPAGGGADPELAGRRVLIVDAEDTFTSMIARQLRSLGLDVAVRRFDEPYDVDEHELVVMGPGPGDPTDLADPKIAALRTTIGRLLDEDRPFLAVCLSHQTLCALLGLELVRRAVPNQGLQKEIDLFGRRTRVGFYNTFAGHSDTDLLAGGIEVCRDRESGEIHALRAASFHSMQFHAESVLTADGVAILRDALTGLLRPAASPRLAA
jgi:phenazine biosynthesis protein phzE